MVILFTDEETEVREFVVTCSYKTTEIVGARARSQILIF